MGRRRVDGQEKAAEGRGKRKGKGLPSPSRVRDNEKGDESGANQNDPAVSTMEKQEVVGHEAHRLGDNTTSNNHFLVPNVGFRSKPANTRRKPQQTLLRSASSLCTSGGQTP